MGKTKNFKNVKKIMLISVISVLLCASLTVGSFLFIFPIKPAVQVKSATESIENTESLLVGSYNTAAPWGNLIEGTYTERRAYLCAQQLNDVMPDSIGVQEFTKRWEEIFSDESVLPQYAYYGVPRGGDSDEKKSEMNGILYLRDKYELVESDTFWISETPDEKNTKFEGAGCNRVVSYVVLKNFKTDFVYIHINTHLDNVSEEAKNLGAELIIKKVGELAETYGNVPVVITGDFNGYEDSYVCEYLKNNGFANANTDNKLPTYHAWGENPHTEPIDFIYIKEFTVSEYQVHNYKKDKSYVSDHYMITARLTIENN